MHMAVLTEEPLHRSIAAIIREFERVAKFRRPRLPKMDSIVRKLYYHVEHFGRSLFTE